MSWCLLAARLLLIRMSWCLLAARRCRLLRSASLTGVTTVQWWPTGSA